MTERVESWARVVYDGLGLENEAVGPVLQPACTACDAPMTLVVKRVLDLAPIRHGVPTALGLTPYDVAVDCPRCGREHRATVGYGEYQPARYIAVLEGIARRLTAYRRE